MMTSVAVSGIVVLISLILFFILCFKGFGPIPVAIILSILVSLTVEGGITKGIWEYFAGGMGGMAGGLCFTFITGSIFGGFMTAAGASERIGRTLINRFGPKFGPYSLIIFVMCLSYVGVGSFVFLGAILAFSLMKASNMPRQVACVAIVGAGYLSTYYLPGSTGNTNLILAAAFGTNTYAGTSIGIVACVLGLILNVFYINWVINKYRKKGIGYTETDIEKQLGASEMAQRKLDELPGFAISIAPMLLVVALTMVFQLGLKIKSYPACTMAQLCGIVLCSLLNWNRLKEKLTVINKSALTAVVPLVQTCVVVGYATIVTNTAAYGVLMDKVSGLKMNPYILVVVATALFAFISADPMAGISMTAKTVGLNAIQMGAAPGLVHRLSLISATTFDSMPHNGNLNATMNFLGLTHKEVYVDIIGCAIVIPLIVTAVTTVMSTLIG
ncbi:MAG: hypothetical protein LBR77_07160 [Lachnospiraceae bacterium]|jgi:H+/gluconate symporter-like permease|nr:hypothetical protein [Lachnospiraceae bacterium]